LAGAIVTTGTTVVTITVTDDFANVDTCTVTLTVADNTPPEITTCPADRTLYVDADCEALVPDLTTEVMAGDNCDTNLTVTQNPLAGAIVTTGTTVVTITVTDDFANVDTCTVTLTVADNTPPEITGCPDDITVNADAGGCTAVVTWTAPSAADNCGIQSFTSDWDPGNTFPGGPTVVTYTATDIHENISTCSFTVTVLAFNDFLLDIEIQGSLDAAIERCVLFTFNDCAGHAYSFEKEVSFAASGLAQDVLLTEELACGNYTCVTAEDELHTIQVRVDLTPDGGQYVADFTGANMLYQGDLYNDNWVDIIDFGVFANRWGTHPPVNTDCATTGFHADMSGNGTVDDGDFTFIQLNFLLEGDGPCCVPFAPGAPQGMPLMEISVAELVARGLGELANADLNGDGLLNTTDVMLFAAGQRPRPPQTVTPQPVTPQPGMQPTPVQRGLPTAVPERIAP